jgi:DNA-binding winged helix-turn-helix (wHTH) protein
MRFIFEDCVFDRDRRELTRNDTIVHAAPKVLALLELLIDARPRALTKDEIHKSLWSGTFVSDATLTSLLAELRAAIGDHARMPRVIRTIHGYGYRFDGKVAVEAPASRAQCQQPESRGSRFSEQPTFRLIVGDREIALGYGEHILGRSNEAAIFVDDAAVSRQHARITIDEAGATLRDLGSKNGTMLNGHAIEAPAPLKDGALIVLGATGLRFRVFKGIGSTETRACDPSR